MMPRGIVPDLPAMDGANTPAKGAERQFEEHRHAWEREMERAQLAAWLAHDPLKTAGTTKQQTRIESKPRGHELAGPTQATASLTAGANAAAELEPKEGAGIDSGSRLSRREVPHEQHEPHESHEAHEPPEPGDPDVHEQTRRLATALQVFGYVQVTATVSGTDQSGTDGDSGEAETQSQSAAPRAPVGSVARPEGSSPASPIRLHADWSADGVRLWLGLDANVLDQMGAIADQVRQWMRGQGVRMLSVTCNGRQLEDDVNTPSELAETMNDTGPLLKPQEKQSWLSAQ